MQSRLQILYNFVLRAEIATIFGTQYKSIQNLQTLQGYIYGYIFRILQHFATKFLLILVWSFTLSSCGDLVASPCLVLKLVYNANCIFSVTFSVFLSDFSTKFISSKYQNIAD